MVYDRERFREVPNVPGQFYCPGCNDSPDQFDMPSVNCPCATHGTGHGSLTTAGVRAYLVSVGR